MVYDFKRYDMPVIYDDNVFFQSFNLKYVQIVEERLNEALTTYERTYDGSYVRRSNRR